MRIVRNFFGLVGITLVGLTGCVHPSQPDLKPNRPDDFVLPPVGLYAKPGEYPKEYLNQVPGRKDTNPEDVAPVNPGMNRMGAGRGPGPGG
jgi:hypothetical protein